LPAEQDAAPVFSASRAAESQDRPPGSVLGQMQPALQSTPIGRSYQSVCDPDHTGPADRDARGSRRSWGR
jgi:hypothetical protein